MTDLDGELERLRAEARHRLDGERELEEKLASYERELRDPPRVDAVTDDADDESVEEKRAQAPKKTNPLAASLAAKAAEESARSAAKSVSALSTPRLLAYLVGLIFAAWIVNQLIGPIIALAVLAVFVILGYRFLRWFTSPDDGGSDGDDEDDGGDDGAEPEA